MQIGEFKNFYEYLGVAKILHQESEKNKKEEWYVVYADIFFDENYLQGQLGDVIGKGKTETDSLKDAIINLTLVIKKRQDFYEKIKESLNHFTEDGYLDDEVILPIARSEFQLEKDGTYYNKEGEEKVNATIYETENGAESGES